MDRNVPAIARALRGKLIVSCQADAGDPFRDPETMSRFARAAVENGAAGIRANGAADIAAIRRVVAVPIIGIEKVAAGDGEILITPTFEAARVIVEAGATLVALDCTARGQRYGAFERLARIRRELGVPVLADIATVEEALAAAGAGADLVLSTLRGYTWETRQIIEFDAAFIRELAGRLDVPVIAEGRIDRPLQAREALAAGAFAVVVGTAITRPGVLTKRFAEALGQGERPGARTYIAAIDLGGTNTKSGVVSSDGEMICRASDPTPVGGGRDALLGHLKKVAAGCLERAAKEGVTISALGVATAGWVDPFSGRVVFATENLPGWTGTPIADELGAATGLPVAVENDANALAVAEKRFGLAKQARNFVCITLGTGVGGGCYVNGELNRGANFFGNALGHIPIQMEGAPCNCGRNGCLEVYANAAALLRYAEAGGFSSTEAVIGAANSGDAVAEAALRTYSRYLASGCAVLVQLLDPEMIVLSGGLAEKNPLLPRLLEEELRARVMVWELRGLQIRVSALGYHGGVYGAAAITLERTG